MAEKETTKTKKASKLGQPLGGSRMPSKTSINLLIEESHTREYTFEIVLFLAFMVGVGFFTKFMVIDQIRETDQMEGRYTQTAEMLDSLVSSNSIFEEVRAEYSHYGNSYLNDEEKNEQDRMAVLKVIEEQLLEKDALQSIQISGNVAQLIINSEKLRNVSEIVAALEDETIVEYVTVSTSQSDRPSQLPEDLQQAQEAVQAESADTETAADTDAPAALSDGDLSSETAPAESTEAADESAEPATDDENASAEPTATPEPMLPEKSVVTTMTIYFKAVTTIENEQMAAENAVAETQTEAGGDY